ncbi:MAG: hypothetical protein IJ341_02820 [Bacteroidales bacterium]|nr:hypothetical protein [Bacteroidales bacterium]
MKNKIISITIAQNTPLQIHVNNDLLQYENIKKYADANGYEIFDSYTFTAKANKYVADELKCLFGIINNFKDNIYAVCFDSLGCLTGDSSVFLAPLFQAALNNNILVISVKEGQFSYINNNNFNMTDVDRISKTLFSCHSNALISIISDYPTEKKQEEIIKSISMQTTLMAETHNYNVVSIINFHKNNLDESKLLCAEKTLENCDCYIIVNILTFSQVKIFGNQIPAKIRIVERKNMAKDISFTEMFDKTIRNLFSKL